MEAPKNKPEPKVYSEKDLLKAGFYKGYDIGWLRKNEDHPDFNVVAEFDNLKK